MNGVWRTALLFHSSRKSQLWLAAAGMALLAAAPKISSVMSAEHSSHWLWLVGMMQLGVWLLGACLLIGVTSTRQLLSTRTLSLIPHARIQILLGLLLSPLLLAVCTAVPVVLLDPHIRFLDIHWGGARDTVEILWALMTFFVLWFFVATRSIWVIIVTAAIGITAPHYLGFLRGPIAAFGIADALAYAALAASLGFIAWYARAPMILPPRDGWQGFFDRGPGSPSDADMSPRLALETLLLGHPSKLSALREHFTVIASNNALLLSMGLYSWFMRHYFSILFLCAPVVAMSILGAQGLRSAARIAEGSRRVWVIGGKTRWELFLACERLAWKCLMTLALPVVIVCAVEWLIVTQGHGSSEGPWKPMDGFYLLLVTFELACCGLYVGLSTFGGDPRTKPWFLAWVVLSMLTPVHPVLLSMAPETASLIKWGTPICLLLSALALRTFAIMRWRRIDWLGRTPAPRMSPVPR